MNKEIVTNLEKLVEGLPKERINLDNYETENLLVFIGVENKKEQLGSNCSEMFKPFEKGEMDS